MKYIKYAILFLAFFTLVACGDNKPKTIKKAPTKREMPRPTSKKVSPKTETASEKTADATTQTTPTPPEHLEKAAAIIASVDMEKVGSVNAKKKFKQFCAACHGFDFMAMMRLCYLICVMDSD